MCVHVGEHVFVTREGKLMPGECACMGAHVYRGKLGWAGAQLGSVVWKVRVIGS